MFPLCATREKRKRKALQGKKMVPRQLEEERSFSVTQIVGWQCNGSGMLARTFLTLQEEEEAFSWLRLLLACNYAVCAYTIDFPEKFSSSNTHKWQHAKHRNTTTPLRGNSWNLRTLMQYHSTDSCSNFRENPILDDIIASFASNSDFQIALKSHTQYKEMHNQNIQLHNFKTVFSARNGGDCHNALSRQQQGSSTRNCFKGAWKQKISLDH